MFCTKKPSTQVTLSFQLVRFFRSKNNHFIFKSAEKKREHQGEMKIVLNQPKKAPTVSAPN
jgi:hypothetical protein